MFSDGDTTPKQIRNVAGKPLMRYFLDTADEIGLTSFVSVLNGEHPQADSRVSEAAKQTHSTVVPVNIGTLNAAFTPYDLYQDQFRSKHILIVPADVIITNPKIIFDAMHIYSPPRGWPALYTFVTTHLTQPHGVDRIVRLRNGRFDTIATQREIDLLKEQGGSLKLSDGSYLTADELENIHEVAASIHLFHPFVFKLVRFIFKLIQWFKGPVHKDTLSSRAYYEKTKKLNRFAIVRTGFLFRFFMGTDLLRMYEVKEENGLLDLNTPNDLSNAEAVLKSLGRVPQVRKVDVVSLSPHSVEGYIASRTGFTGRVKTIFADSAPQSSARTLPLGVSPYSVDGYLAGRMQTPHIEEEDAAHWVFTAKPPDMEKIARFSEHLKSLPQLAQFLLREFFSRLSAGDQEKILNTFGEYHGKNPSQDQTYFYQQARRYFAETNKQDFLSEFDGSSYSKDLNGFQLFLFDRNGKDLQDRFLEWHAAQPYAEFFRIAGIEKVGQFLSTSEGLVPEGMREAFEVFQDQGTPAEMGEIVRSVENYYGKPLVEALVPIEGAAIEMPYLKRLKVGTVADTFLAKTHDGQEVVLKVVPAAKKRKILSGLEKIREVIKTLENSKEKFTGADAIQMSPSRFFEEFEKAVRRELNMNVEAKQARQLVRHYPDGFSKPAIYGSNENVLEMSFVKGIKATELKNPLLRRRTARRLILLIVLAALADGVFHSDPHPGNIFGEELTWMVSLFDFGQVGYLSGSLRRDLVSVGVRILQHGKKPLSRFGLWLVGCLLSIPFVVKILRFFLFWFFFSLVGKRDPNFLQKSAGESHAQTKKPQLTDDDEALIVFIETAFKEFIDQYRQTDWYRSRSRRYSSNDQQKALVRDKFSEFLIEKSASNPKFNSRLINLVQWADTQTDKTAFDLKSDFVKMVLQGETYDSTKDFDEAVNAILKELENKETTEVVDDIVGELTKHGETASNYNEEKLKADITSLLSNPPAKWQYKQPYLMVDRMVYTAEADGFIILTPYTDIVRDIFAFVERYSVDTETSHPDVIGLKAEIASILRFHRRGESMFPKINRILLASERYGFPVISSAGMLIKSIMLAEGVQRLLKRETVMRAEVRLNKSSPNQLSMESFKRAEVPLTRAELRTASASQPTVAMSELRDKKVVITGAGGNIGSVLMDMVLPMAKRTTPVLLKEEFAPFSGYRFDYQDKAGIEVRTLPDIHLQRALVNQNDVIFHLAMWGAAGAKDADISEFMYRNVLPAAIFVKTAQESSHKPRIVFASTMRVYDLMDLKGKRLLKETGLKLEPKLETWVQTMVQFFIGLSSAADQKKTLEEIRDFLSTRPPPVKYATKLDALAKSICERIINQYENGVSLRLGNVYGPAYDSARTDLNRRLVHRYLYQVAHGAAELKYSPVRKNLTYVDDVARAFVRAAVSSLDQLRDQRVINVGARRRYSDKEVAQAIIDASGSDAALILDTASKEIPRLLMDTRRMKAILGLDPNDFVTPAEGIRRTWQWMTQPKEARTQTWSNRFFRSEVRNHKGSSNQLSIATDESSWRGQSVLPRAEVSWQLWREQKTAAARAEVPLPRAELRTASPPGADQPLAEATTFSQPTVAMSEVRQGEEKQVSEGTGRVKKPNVNLMKPELLRRYVDAIPQLNLLDQSVKDRLAQWILAKRPFKTRQQFEMALQGTSIKGLKREEQEAIAYSFKTGISRRGLLGALAAAAAMIFSPIVYFSFMRGKEHMLKSAEELTEEHKSYGERMRQERKPIGQFIESLVRAGGVQIGEGHSEYIHWKNFVHALDMSDWYGAVKFLYETDLHQALEPAVSKNEFLKTYFTVFKQMHKSVTFIRDEQGAWRNELLVWYMYVKFQTWFQPFGTPGPHVDLNSEMSQYLRWQVQAAPIFKELEIHNQLFQQPARTKAGAPIRYAQGHNMSFAHMARDFKNPKIFQPGRKKIVSPGTLIMIWRIWMHQERKWPGLRSVWKELRTMTNWILLRQATSTKANGYGYLLLTELLMMEISR